MHHQSQRSSSMGITLTFLGREGLRKLRCNAGSVKRYSIPLLPIGGFGAIFGR